MHLPLSYHLAFALAEAAHRWSFLKWMALVVAMLATALALVTQTWWPGILAVLAACDAFLLYVGEGIYGLLEEGQVNSVN